METSLPTPMTARVHVNLPEDTRGYMLPIVALSRPGSRGFEKTESGLQYKARL